MLVLPGTRDGALAHDARLIDAVAANGWELALGCVLEIDTGCGPRVVRIEPGHRFDRTSAFADPRDPHDHPLTQHLERDVLPGLAAAADAGSPSSWLQGVEDADPADMGSLVASRFAYRRLFRRAAWLTLPVLALLAVFFPVAAFSARHTDSLSHVFRLLAAGFLIELTLVVVALTFVILQLRDALSSVPWWARDRRGNDEARGAAVVFATAGGNGLITGHTRLPELTDLGNGGFYANCGVAGRVVERMETRLGLPPVYGGRLRCSWVELEAGSDLDVRLWHGQRDLPERTLLERLADSRTGPIGVAADRGGRTPGHRDVAGGRRRHCRPTAHPPHRRGRDRVRGRDQRRVGRDAADRARASPRSIGSRVIEVPEAAAALVALAGIGLILLSRGVRRGQRFAWTLASALLLVSAGRQRGEGPRHRRGIDLADRRVVPDVAPRRLHRTRAIRRRSGGRSARCSSVFRSRSSAARSASRCVTRKLSSERDRRRGRRAARWDSERRRCPLGSIIWCRRRCWPSVSASRSRSVWMLFRPAVAARASSFRPMSRDRARFLVERYGADSLSYFALREDKEWFGFRDTLVAYRVHNGIALVSPDPIGPVGQRAEAWSRVP